MALKLNRPPVSYSKLSVFPSIVHQGSKESKMQVENEDNARQTNPVVKVTQPEKQCQPACPVCGGSLIDIRAKLQCSECHRICETCCEGGRG